MRNVDNNVADTFNEQCFKRLLLQQLKYKEKLEYLESYMNHTWCADAPEGGDVGTLLVVWEAAALVFTRLVGARVHAFAGRAEQPRRTYAVVSASTLTHTRTLPATKNVSLRNTNNVSGLNMYEVSMYIFI